LVYAWRVSSDYTTVGHVTVDLMADGSRRPGGGAFYSALQAARLGWSARIVTRGVRAEIEALLAPYSTELALDVTPSPRTTTLESTLATGGVRAQRMLAWAGEMRPGAELDATIVHFAPVARETGAYSSGRARFVGVTPQGLVRTWPRLGAPLRARRLDSALMPDRCDAVVISSAERESCAPLLHEHGGRAGSPIVAVTDAAAPTQLHLPDGRTARVPVPPVAEPRDEIGAGDVFAAAFFVALAEGSPAEQAAAFATAAAAVRIVGDGPGAVGDRTAILARAAAVA
jgi:sugar/nucleoside kinase (ribokinase family)